MPNRIIGRFLSISFTITTLLCLTHAASAKSLYVLNHPSSYIYVLKVDGNLLTYQYDGRLKDYGPGAIDITIDENSQTLFVTYERGGSGIGGNTIELRHAKNLDYLDTIAVETPCGFSDNVNLTGLAYDDNSNRSLLYATQRNSNYLFVFHWDARELTLTPTEDSPIALDWTEATDAADDFKTCGLALDGDTLYVSDFDYRPPGDGTPSTNVYMYDVTDDFACLGKIDMGENVVDIDYDSTNDILYGGYDSYLTKHTDGDPNLTKNIGASMWGVAADDDTGLVYLTTFREPNEWVDEGAVEVWDTSDWTTDPNYADPCFVYDNENNDNVIVEKLAGLTLGGPYFESEIHMIKKADVATVYPRYQGDPCYIEYTICYDPENTAHTGVLLTDLIPRDVWPFEPNDLLINPMNQTILWVISDIDDTDPCACVSFRAYVDKTAEPCTVITNVAELESDTAFSRATVTTKVACWGGDIIYVDATATGSNTGTSWDDAYVLLQDAIDRANRGCGDEIWVAQGAYSPGCETTDTFILYDDIAIYGGFDANETVRSQRDFLKQTTILTGLDTANCVVTAHTDATTDAMLDGFTIQDASQCGINITSAYPVIANCVIQDNEDDGVYINGGSPTIYDCLIKDNGESGIECRGSSQSPDIARCNIYDNADGVYASDANPTITNCILHHNYSHGINLSSADAAAEIRNNTICYNGAYGVSSTGTAPDIVNCIIWDNTSGPINGSSTPEYCCLNDPSDPDGSSTPDDDNNITCDPCFAYNADVLYDFHINSASYCVDKGDNTDVAVGETDIDGEDRIEDGNGDANDVVDMGAHEVWCETLGHECDLNADGTVNLPEFACLADAWQDSVDPNDPNFCDCDADGNIDLVDLCCLAETWLWQICYYGGSGDGWTGMEGIGDAPPPSAPLGGGGGESMMMALPMEATALDTTPSLPTEAAIRARAQQNRLAKIRREWSNYDPSLEQEVMQLRAIIDWLEDLWVTDPDIQSQVGKDDFWKFVGKLEQELDALITQLWKEYDGQ